MIKIFKLFYIFLLIASFAMHSNSIAGVVKKNLTRNQNQVKVVFKVLNLDLSDPSQVSQVLDEIKKTKGVLTEITPDEGMVVEYQNSQVANAVLAEKQKQAQAWKESQIPTQDPILSAELYKPVEQKMSSSFDSPYPGPFKLLSKESVLEDLNQLSKLIKPLEDRELRKLGSNRVRSNVRVDAKKKSRNEISSTMLSESLPTSVDLSKTKYFPGIGNQGPLGTCQGWSGGHYVHSYEVLKNASKPWNFKTMSADVGLTGSEWEETFSVTEEDLPKVGACSVPYIYSFTGSYQAASKTTAIPLLNMLYLLTNLGCAPVRDVPPWIDINQDRKFNENFFPTIKNQLVAISRRAAEIRIFADITDKSTEFSKMVNSQRDVVQDIKKVLSAGYLVGGLGIPVYSDFDNNQFAKTPCDSDGVYIPGRCWKSNSTSLVQSLVQLGLVKKQSNKITYRGAHAATLVGYDDNKAYQVNGQSRKGAFKLANSWGTAFGPNDDPGFYWIPYDEFYKEKSVVNDLDKTKEWTPGTSLPGFPDESHAYVFGVLYFTPGVANQKVESFLTVKIKQPSDQKYTRFFTEFWDKNKKYQSKNFGEWSKDWWSYQSGASIEESTLLGASTEIGPILKPDTEFEIVQDVTEPLNTSEFPVKIRINGQVAEKFTKGTEVISASFMRRHPYHGFLSLPVSFPKVEVSGKSNVFEITLDESNLPALPKRGSFCREDGQVILFYCDGSENLTEDWVRDPAAHSCFQHRTELKCDPLTYQKENTFFYFQDGAITFKACNQNKPSPSGWIRRKGCYHGRTGIQSF